MNLLEIFSGTGSVGTIAKSLGFNDARKMAVRLAEKWRSGWPKSGGQGARKKKRMNITLPIIFLQKLL